MNETDSLFRFNPRTRTGCDTISDLHFYGNYTFQSTHPHGVRQLKALLLRSSILFQSTHPHGVRRQPAFNSLPY